MSETPNDPDRPSGDNFAVHLSFIIVLAAILAIKYRLYFSSPATEHGLTDVRIGATVAHLLMWTFAYTMCRRTRRKVLLGILAAPTLFFGVLTVPILGWVGIVVMFVAYRVTAKRDGPRESPDVESANGAEGPPDGSG